jgi:hypothetical protein
LRPEAGLKELAESDSDEVEVVVGNVSELVKLLWELG